MANTFRQNLIARRNAIGVDLAAVQNTDRPEYKEGLYNELLAIDQLLASNTVDQTASDTLAPFEQETRGIT